MAKISQNKLDEKQRKKREELISQFEQRFRTLFLNERGKRRLLAIPDEKWEQVQREIESA